MNYQMRLHFLRNFIWVLFLSIGGWFSAQYTIPEKPKFKDLDGNGVINGGKGTAEPETDKI